MPKKLDKCVSAVKKQENIEIIKNKKIKSNRSIYELLQF